MKATKGKTKRCPQFSSFQIFFEQSGFNCFQAKCTFELLQKKMHDSLLERTQVRFGSVSCWKCVYKV